MPRMTLFAIVAVLSLSCTAVGAQQVGPVTAPPAQVPYSYDTNAPQPPVYSPPNAQPGYTNPQGYQQPTAEAYPPPNQSPYPNYPYPPYHNPYYNGMSPKNMLSNTIDWLLALPSTVAGNFSNILDSRVFPAQPAGSGGRPPHTVQPSAPPVPDSAPTGPLPPAQPYVRNPR